MEQTLHELKAESPGYWCAVVEFLDMFLLLGVLLLLECDFGVSVGKEKSYVIWNV